MERLLFVGDVHGCALELESLLRTTRPTRVVLLGDLFTRGPDPRGVWKLIRKYEAVSVLGNHDVHVLQSWKPGRELPKAAFRWLQQQPLVRSEPGWLAVHAGIHPKKPWRTDAKQALFGRRHPKWWRTYRGDDLVIHGHQARRTVRDDRPRHLCLDTDCARGGALTGYLFHEDELVSVPARSLLMTRCA